MAGQRRTATRRVRGRCDGPRKQAPSATGATHAARPLDGSASGMVADQQLLGGHCRPRTLVHRRLHPLGRAARDAAPDGSDAPNPRKLSAISLLLPEGEWPAAHVPHATLAADTGAPMVSLVRS